MAESSGIISISKLKTHALTRITGAIKNQFGCIPGARKAEFHSVMPTVALFSQMLVDLNLFLKPRLFIMDGIIAMEGNGPRNGDARKMNVLLFSTDPVALDATVCRLINLNPDLVEPLVYGAQSGLGTMTNIDYVGDPIEEFIVPDFAVNRSLKKTSTDSSFLEPVLCAVILLRGRPLKRIPAPNADAAWKYALRCLKLFPGARRARPKYRFTIIIDVSAAIAARRCALQRDLCQGTALGKIDQVVNIFRKET